MKSMDQHHSHDHLLIGSAIGFFRFLFELWEAYVKHKGGYTNWTFEILDMGVGAFWTALVGVTIAFFWKRIMKRVFEERNKPDIEDGD